jgi:S-adenosylmethionine hydrolase
MSAPPSIITLTTDFGQTDHYVAQMKGVILGVTPTASLVDVTHEIPPQNVRRAAYLIAELAEAFPAGSVHVAVVDPGVGSDRSLLAVRAEGQFYIAPDNGLLSLVLEQRRVDETVVIENERYRRPKVTATFHGRDIMAPAAAHLASGVAISELGPQLDRPAVRLLNLLPEISESRIDASVAWIDRFGNIITNVGADLVREWDSRSVCVSFGDRCISQLRNYYAEVPVGEPLLLVGSSGRVEIGINGGSAAALFGVRAGDRLVLDRSDG